MESKMTIPKPCNANWNTMSPAKDGRFCNSCNKTVIDFTKMDNPEIQKYFTDNSGKGSIRGHFKSDQIVTKQSIKYDNLRNSFSRIRIKPIQIIALLSLSLVFTLSGCIMGKAAETTDGEPTPAPAVNNNMNESNPKTEQIDSLKSDTIQVNKKQ